MTEIIAQRVFSPAYIVLDCLFLLVLALLLLWQKKFATVLVGLAAGVLYMLVDYGIFHLLCGARSINAPYSLFWVLLWMSMSYGFTNFVWIWLWVQKDRHLFAWSCLIWLWWFCCPLLAQGLSAGAAPIVIQRTTSGYHGWMALILFVGYLGVIVWNLSQDDRARQLPLGWMLAIGVLVQLGWEAALLLGGIRSAEIADWGQKLRTLAVNSLLETNLGMPYLYVLHLLYARRFTERLTRRPARTFVQALEENNARRVRRSGPADGYGA